MKKMLKLLGAVPLLTLIVCAADHPWPSVKTATVFKSTVNLFTWDN